MSDDGATTLNNTDVITADTIEFTMSFKEKKNKNIVISYWAPTIICLLRITLYMVSTMLMMVITVTVK